MNNPAIKEQIRDERLMQEAYFVLVHFLVVFVISARDFGHVFQWGEVKVGLWRRVRATIIGKMVMFISGWSAHHTYPKEPMT